MSLNMKSLQMFKQSEGSCTTKVSENVVASSASLKEEPRDAS